MNRTSSVSALRPAIGRRGFLRAALASSVLASAGVAFARLLVGMALKWLLVLVALLIALAVFRLPGVPLMAGVIAATLALVLANSIRR